VVANLLQTSMCVVVLKYKCKNDGIENLDEGSKG
jgi:hypothetical protein